MIWKKHGISNTFEFIDFDKINSIFKLRSGLRLFLVMQAIISGNIDVIEKLISVGANVEVKDW